MIKKTRLNSGIRVLTEQLAYLHSVALGIVFNHGSRDEKAEENGVAHLLEHIFFKGTEKKTAKEISNFAESKGIIVDGFTSKESTGIYARFLSEHTESAMNLLCEIISQPGFSPVELEKEKMVISEEINSEKENPEDRVFNLLFETLFKGHPMGLPIAGEPETINNFDTKTLRSYYNQNYSMTKAIVVGAGEIDYELITKMVESQLALPKLGLGNNRQPPPAIKPSYKIESRNELSQVYIGLGKPVFPFSDERRYALSVLNTGLGGSLSSRLFQRLREDEGLVYTVSSFVDLYFDCGLIGIYFITDYKKLNQGLKATLEEIRKLSKEGFNSQEFSTALNLTKSSIILGLENPLSRMMRMAKNELLLGEPIDLDTTLASYNRLTLDEVNQLLSEIFPPDISLARFGLSAVGPLKEKDLEPIISQ